MKFCIVTGTRAEWGLMSRLARKIQMDPDSELRIVATHAHLVPEFGDTAREIEADGFSIACRVPSWVKGDTPLAAAESMGRAVSGLGEAFAELRPDWLILLGDRYETFAAAGAAQFFRIPIAHIHGGEISEGACDDAFRHAITKLSALHFTATEEYRRRVIQLGEAPERVFYVGAPGCENIRAEKRIPRAELSGQLNFDFGKRLIVVTYHPETLSSVSPEEQSAALLEALGELPEEYHFLLTRPNADPGGGKITRQLETFVRANPGRTALFTSLGQRRYLSALGCAAAVVGNSSSGIIEAPSFGIPTLDIGNRQGGRTAASSVVHCGGSREDIRSGLWRILDDEFIARARTTVNPYEKPGCSQRILEVLKSCGRNFSSGKTFHDLKETGIC